MSATVRTPPPTVSGMKARRAVRSTMSRSVPATFGGRRDVQEDEFVGALGRIALGELGRVALIDEVHEARALDDAAVGDVQAGDDPPAQHQAAFTSSTKFARSRRPSAPLRSGWNWTPSVRPRAMADTNASPWVVSATTIVSLVVVGAPA